jgi:DNA-binding protein HU-beta
MKKADLVDAIAGKSGAPKAQVQQLVEDVFELMADALSRGDKIDLRGFGTFSVRASAARTGRNPQTGEPIQIPARNTPAFKPGKELKDRCNQAGATAAATPSQHS